MIIFHFKFFEGGMLEKRIMESIYKDIKSVYKDHKISRVGYENNLLDVPCYSVFNY